MIESNNYNRVMVIKDIIRSPFFLICLFLMLFLFVSPAEAGINRQGPIIDIIDSSSVRFSWNTSIPVNYSFKYGPNTEHDSWDIKKETEYSKTHELMLTNLEPGVRHGYNCDMYNNGGTEKNTMTGVFTTPDANPPPQPTGLKLIEVDENSVEFIWDEYNDSEVDDFRRFIIYRDGEKIDESITPKYEDDNLEGSTIYTYNIAGNDDTGNIGSQSQSLIVTTDMPDTIPPEISSVKVLGVKNTTATVFWRTNEESDSKVYYGVGEPDLMDDRSGRYFNHTVAIKGLEKDRTYNYIASSCDENGNCANSSIYSFTAGGDYSPPPINVELPEKHNSNQLKVNGTTEPLARILFYINNAEIPNRVVLSDIDGYFETTIYLDTSKEMNKIKLRAEDSAGNHDEEVYNIKVDSEKPVVSITPLPSVHMESSLEIKGNISEKATLKVYVETESDRELGKPSIVDNFEADSIRSNNIRLDWDSNNRSEKIEFYKVYVNSEFIATTRSPGYSVCVKNQTHYTFEVSAVNEQCEEGPLSYAVSLTTPVGRDCDDDIKEIEHECSEQEPEQESELNPGSFTERINLEEGMNNINLVFMDDVGNKFNIRENVIYDKEPPKIIDDNLDEVSPAYKDEITITGRVNERATVTVTVNDDSDYVANTDEEGYFSVDVELERLDYKEINEKEDGSIRMTGNMVKKITGNSIEEVPEGNINYDDYYSYMHPDAELETTSLTWNVKDGKYDNLIEISAVDSVGRQSQRNKSGWVEYMLCSSEGAWDVQLSKPKPSILIPYNLITGISQITFTYELEWLGSLGGFDDDEIPKPSVDFYLRDVSEEEEKEWDLEWFSSIYSKYIPDTNNTKGYVMIQSRHHDKQFRSTGNYRHELAESIRENDTENFTTALEKEQNVSEHRKGECMDPEFGCVKLPITMEIDYNDPIYDHKGSNVLGYDIDSDYDTSITQRKCIDIEMGIDKRVDTSVIPEDFLKSGIKFLNETINIIDSVLEPLDQIKKWTLRACLVSFGINYVNEVDRAWHCTYKNTLDNVFGNGFNPAVASQGLCNAFYGQKDNDELLNGDKHEACMTCQEKTQKVKDFKQHMQMICDRLACPSAPSFVSYIKEVNQDEPRTTELDISDVKNGVLTLPEMSDCYGVEANYKTIKEQYDRWKNYTSGIKEYTFHNPKEGSANKLGYNADNFEKVTCSDLHAYNQDCCVFEYMELYDSVCGLNKGFLFDEMKESYCVAGKNVEKEGDELSNFEDDCGGAGRKVWNAITGICENTPSAEVQLVMTNFEYKVQRTTGVYVTASEEARAEKVKEDKVQKAREKSIKSYSKLDDWIGSSDESSRGDYYYYDTTFEGDCPIVGSKDDSRIYFRISPDPENTGDDQKYIIEQGYVTQNVDVDRTTFDSYSKDEGLKGKKSAIGRTEVFTPLNGITINSEWFSKLNKDKVDSRNTYLNNDILNPEGYNNFKDALTKCIEKDDNEGEDLVLSSSAQSRIKEAYKKIQSEIGITDKPIIVDPSSSLLRSFQCLCLPGMTSYLKLWRAISVAVKSCFQTILITGDGNPGVCRGVLSQYVCDLIYDAIRCFSMKYDTGISRSGGYAGIGNMLGTLTTAGRETQRTVTSRYGNAGFYKALFNDRKLMHSVCMWAFTGSFDLDLDSVLEGQYGDIPVDSQVLISPCTRRFMSYDPVTGRATYNYFFGAGIVAGSEMSYRTYLQCSTGMDCKYGYGEERCDCSGNDDPRRDSVNLRSSPSRLDRYEVVEDEFNAMVTEDYRYDKVVIEYYYRNKDGMKETKTAECNFRTVGGTAPGFCSFDPHSGKFLCSVDAGSSSYVDILKVDDGRGNNGWDIGETLDIDVRVDQKLSDELDCINPEFCPETKYISMELNNQNGKTIVKPLTDGTYRPILREGVTTYSLPSTGHPIRAEDLGGSSSEPYECGVIEPSDSFVKSCSGKFMSEDEELKLKWKKDKTPPDNQVVVVLDDGKEKNLSKNKDGDTPCILNDDSKYCYHKLSDGEFISFHLVTKDEQGNDIANPDSITIKPKASTGESFSGCGDKEQVTWEGRVIVYESAQNQDGFSPISDQIYQYNGNNVEKPFSIKINCDEDAENEDEEKKFDDYLQKSGIKIGNNNIDSISSPLTEPAKLNFNTKEKVDYVMYDIKKDGNSILDGTKPVHMSADRGNKNSWKSKNLYTYLNDNGEYELVIIIKYDDDLLQNTIEFSIPTSS